MAVTMTCFGEFDRPFAPCLVQVGQDLRIDGAQAWIDGVSGRFPDLSHLQPGDLVLADGVKGRLRTLYRAGSDHNALFLTEDCNSNCLMCSQPPKKDGGMVDLVLAMIDRLADQPPARLGITGGEPTLLGDGFLAVLRAIKDKLPATHITALSNGRTFADRGFVAHMAQVLPPSIRFSIPLHADLAQVHDHIAQAPGAFAQTLAGFYALAAAGIDAEIRVVLHGQSVPRLAGLADFIARKLPFAAQTVFMGLEQMGYVKKNWDQLWIDPVDYAVSLDRAVQHLYRRGLDVSVYNLPFCVLPPSLWGFARQSISDHKQSLSSLCAPCPAQSHCAGFFTSGLARPSRAIGAETLISQGAFIDTGAARP